MTMKKTCLAAISLLLILSPIGYVTAETPTVIEQTETEESSNFAPLLKAISKMVKSDRYAIESTLQMHGKSLGMEAYSNAKIETTIASPNRFRSKITFTRPSLEEGLEGLQYEAISDGSRVLIHDLHNKEYSVVSYQKFLDVNETFMLGMLSSFYLSIQSEDINSDLEALLNQNYSEAEAQNLLKALLTRALDSDVDNIEVRNETIDKIDYLSYRVKGSQDDRSLNILLEPQTPEVHSLIVSGKEDGSDFILKEKLIRQEQPEDISDLTFGFVPPRDSTKSAATIRIEPF